MKKAAAPLLSAFMLAISSLPVSAALINVDPDAFASGTDISSAFAGVTLSGPGQTDTAVYSLASAALASTGLNVFGSGDDGVEWGDGFNAGMRVDFATATNFVSIDIIGNDGLDIGRLLAFDAADTLLATYTTGDLSTGIVETASISRAAADIAYVIATGDASAIQSISLDNLVFSAVPEPASLALVALGMAGIGYQRRRQRKVA